MNIPLVVFLYNRPEHAENLLNCVGQLRDVENTDIHIYIDGPKNEFAYPLVKKTQEVVFKFIESRPELNIHLTLSDENKGLAISVINGVTEIINKYKYIIVLEDDLLLSKDFLVFMKNALNFYKDNQKIWSISGFSLPLLNKCKIKNDIYLGYRASSWGWATWYDRWIRVDWTLQDYEQFIKDENKKSNFLRGGQDMLDMLNRQVNGQIDSWAIRWCYSQSKHDMYTVFPKYSRVINTGCDGTGTHSGTTYKYVTSLYKHDKDAVFVDLNIDDSIQKKLALYYSKNRFISKAMMLRSFILAKILKIQKNI